MNLNRDMDTKARHMQKHVTHPHISPQSFE